MLNNTLILWTFILFRVQEWHTEKRQIWLKEKQQFWEEKKIEITKIEKVKVWAHEKKQVWKNEWKSYEVTASTLYSKQFKTKQIAIIKS